MENVKQKLEDIMFLDSILDMYLCASKYRTGDFKMKDLAVFPFKIIDEFDYYKRQKAIDTIYNNETREVRNHLTGDIIQLDDVKKAYRDFYSGEDKMIEEFITRFIKPIVGRTEYNIFYNELNKFSCEVYNYVKFK